MNWHTVVVVAFVSVLLRNFNLSPVTGADEEECVYAGLSGDRHLYIASNCQPKQCVPKVPVDGFQCTIGNYGDQLPYDCDKVEIALREREWFPPSSVEDVCLPIMSSLGLYDFTCPQLENTVEKALRFTFLLPLCNEEFVKSSQGVKVDFNADNKSESNYFTSYRVCRTYNYSGSDFSTWTNSTMPMEVEDRCMAIGLQDGHQEVIYYIGFTEFPSGVRVNYTTMFRDVDSDSLQLLAGAWLSWEAAHFIFQPIPGIDRYLIHAESDTKGWTVSQEISSPSVKITDIPKSSNTVTVTVSPNDNDMCKRQKYHCSPITLTLIDKSNLPHLSRSVHPPGHSPKKVSVDMRIYLVIAVGAVIAVVLLVVTLLIFRYYRRAYQAARYVDMARWNALWIGEWDSTQSQATEAFLHKRGCNITYAFDVDTPPVELMKNHTIIIVVLPTSLEVSAVSAAFADFIRVLLENRPLWERVRVISYAKNDRELLLPSSVLRRMFTSYCFQQEFLRYLDRRVYRMPKDQKKLAENLMEEEERVVDQTDTESTFSDFATMSLISESAAPSEISEGVRVHTGRRAAAYYWPGRRQDRLYQAVPEGQEQSADRLYQAVPEGQEQSADRLYQAVPEGQEQSADRLYQAVPEGQEQSAAPPQASEADNDSDSSLSQALVSALDTEPEYDDGPSQPLSEDVHETCRKEVVGRSLEASENSEEFNSQVLLPHQSAHETFRKQVLEGNENTLHSGEGNTERKRALDASLTEVSDEMEVLQENLCVEVRSPLSSGVDTVDTEQPPESSDQQSSMVRSVGAAPDSHPDPSDQQSSMVRSVGAAPDSDLDPSDQQSSMVRSVGAAPDSDPDPSDQQSSMVRSVGAAPDYDPDPSDQQSSMVRSVGAAPDSHPDPSDQQSSMVRSVGAAPDSDPDPSDQQSSMVRSVGAAPDSHPDGAREGRTESMQGSAEERLGGQEGAHDFHTDESSVQPLRLDPEEDDIESLESRGSPGRYDMNDRVSLTTTETANDCMRRDESEMVDDDDHSCDEDVSARNLSDEARNGTATGFVPTGPPPFDSRGAAGGEDSSVGSSSRLQLTDTRPPWNTHAASGLLTRWLLEFEVPGYADSLRGRDCQTGSETYTNPHYDGDRDEGGRRQFMPDFEEPQPRPPDGRHGPGYGHLGPGYGHLGPRNGHLGPGYGHLGPGYGHLGPGYGHLGPRYGHLGPGNGHLGPGNGHHGPGNGHLGPGDGHLGPGYGHLGPGNGHLGPGDGHHGPGYGHHGPGDGHHGPGYGHHGPGDGHLGPGDGHHGPGDGHHGPGYGHLGPGNGHLGPGDGHLGPGDGHHGPGDGHHGPGGQGPGAVGPAVRRAPRQPVQHAWPPQDARNDSGCYSLDVGDK